MLLDRVTDLVREDRRKLRFVLQQLEQPGMDNDDAVGCGERVRRLVDDDVILKGDLPGIVRRQLTLEARNQLVPQVADIRLDFEVRQQLESSDAVDRQLPRLVR